MGGFGLWTGRGRRLAVAALIAGAVLLALGGTAAAGGKSLDAARAILIWDKFNLEDGDPLQLDGRVPDTVDAGAEWAVDTGIWSLGGGPGRGYVTEDSGTPRILTEDKRVNIDAGSANVHVEATINYKVGNPNDTQFVGVTARFGAHLEWVGAWYDPYGWDGKLLGGCKRGEDWCGAILLAAKEIVTDPGDLNHPSVVFHEGRARYEWGQGKKHRIAISANGGLLTASVDDRDLVQTAVFPSLGSATLVGMFSRGPGAARFEEFKVTGQESAAAVSASGGDGKGKKGKKG